jgi:hypothetical protein
MYVSCERRGLQGKAWPWTLFHVDYVPCGLGEALGWTGLCQESERGKEGRVKEGRRREERKKKKRKEKEKEFMGYPMFFLLLFPFV